jgi:hypothetical protein
MFKVHFDSRAAKRQSGKAAEWQSGNGKAAECQSGRVAKQHNYHLFYILNMSIWCSG